MLDFMHINIMSKSATVLFIVLISCSSLRGHKGHNINTRGQEIINRIRKMKLKPEKVKDLFYFCRMIKVSTT